MFGRLDAVRLRYLVLLSTLVRGSLLGLTLGCIWRGWTRLSRRQPEELSDALLEYVSEIDDGGVGGGKS